MKTVKMTTEKVASLFDLRWRVATAADCERFDLQGEGYVAGENDTMLYAMDIDCDEGTSVKGFFCDDSNEMHVVEWPALQPDFGALGDGWFRLKTLSPLAI